MSAIIVVGSQWGDEGKGKLVDAFADQADAVVRFQGGANAGHTLIVDGEKTVLHLIPSGILHEHCHCLIASGVTIDPWEVLNEIKGLQSAGYLKNQKQLSISDGALLVLPFHKKLDVARESYKKATKIGTTGRGIGPSYEDRASRRALLFRDLFDEGLKDKLEKLAEERNFLLEKMYGEEPVDVEAVYQDLLKLAEELSPFRAKNATQKVAQWMNQGKKVLFEGAQGVLLDNLHGTFPFVTASCTSAAAACSGAGLGPKKIKRVLGITKAYCTRVGAGPFPTELDDENGERLQKEGHEFGATTGRRRRCGWLDLVALRYAINIGGIDGLALTKLDVLSHFETIKICTSYKLDGELLPEFSMISNDIENAEPVYKELPGWMTDISKCRSFSELPEQAQAFIQYIEDQTGVPATVISVGPDRSETIYQEEIFGEIPAPTKSAPQEIAYN